MSAPGLSTPALSSPKWDVAQWSDFTTVAQESLAQASSPPLPKGDKGASPALPSITKTAERATPAGSFSPRWNLPINSMTGSVRPVNGESEPPSALPHFPTTPIQCASDASMRSRAAVQTPVAWPASPTIFKDQAFETAFPQTPIRLPSSPPPGRHASSPPTLASGPSVLSRMNSFRISSSQRGWGRPENLKVELQNTSEWPSSSPIIRGVASFPPPLAADEEPRRPWSPAPSSLEHVLQQSSPFDMSPPGTFHRKHPVLPVSNPAAVTYLLTQPKTPEKLDEISPVLKKTPWHVDDLRTWPILHLPFHKTPGSSTPTHIDELMTYVHYKGAGAKVLRELLAKAMEELDEEYKREGKTTEPSARGSIIFLCWPFNVNKNGEWKMPTGMSEEEVRVWKSIWEEVREEGFDMRQSIA